MKQPTNLATTRTTAAALSRVAFLQGVDADVIGALARQLHRRDVRRGKSIFCQGEPADGMHVIIDGKVKVCSHAPDGRERLLEIRGPSDILGAESVLDPGPRTATAIALTDVCIATVDGDTLRMWMATQPQVTEQLLQLLARRVRQLNDHLFDLVFDDVPGRVAKELLRLAHRFGTRQDGRWNVRHDLTQTEIAQLVGATRESVNKALCDFVSRGWITLDGKSTLINQPQLLARRAG